MPRFRNSWCVRRIAVIWRLQRRHIEKLMSQNKIHSEIRSEIYRALEYLGADARLLATVGSWGDTLDDAEVLKLLKQWNDVRCPVHQP